MAITPSEFSKIWASNADTPEYTFSEANYLKGWDFVGNLPPTRAQWNAIQKSTDEKMKYVFDNFGAPLTASTVAEMTMQNRVYVYTGSETGYTAGHWYYWNGSAWTDGGVYNSIAFSTDTTLTISGQAADAKATGDAIKSTKAEMSLFGVDDLLWDNANFATNWTHNGITYTLDKINKTVTISGTATNTSVLVFYNNTIPAWLTAGKTYYAHLNTDENVFVQVRETVDGTTTTILSTRNYGNFTINPSATNVVIRLTVFSGNTINTTVRPFISKNLSLGEIEKTIPNDEINTLPSVVANIQPSVEWLDNTAVSDTTGELFPTTYNYSVTKNKIEIPAGSKAYIHLLGDIFIATYDKNGDFIERVSRSNEVDYELDSADIGYFRLQCTSLSQSEIESAFRLRFVYPNGDVSHAEDIQNAECGTLQTITASGNPVVLKNTSASPFDAISISGQTANDNIVVCGKNLFTFYYARLGLTTGGTTYRFDKDNGSIRVTSEGATSTGISANNQLGDDYRYVNNVEWYHNFKFRFASDTYVAIHGHCSVHQTYDYPVQMQVSDGTHTWRVGEDGIVIKALAGVEYGVRIGTRAGFSGDITFYPQVEIGTRPTEFEVYSGSRAVVPTTAGTTNIVNITPAEAIVYKINNAYANVTAVFDRLHREVVLTGETLTSTAVMVAPQTGSINGTELNYISTVNGTGGVVCFKAIPPSMRGKAYAQITDGTTYWRDNGYGVLLDTDASKTYAFRIFLNGNTEFDNVVFPLVVATETEALKLVDSRLDTTTIYTNDNSTIDVTATQTTRVEKVESSYNVTQALSEITAGKILTPLQRLTNRKPMVTFIDDDTSSVALVQRYHDIFTNNGVVGNYAVMTKNLDEQSGLTDLLLDYEEEGFGCLYHCYYQSGDATRYWEANNPAYDETLIKENFMRGLRSMREYGFSNYNMWVTPYGVNDKFIVDLAKNHGMRCLFNCPTVNFGEYGYVSVGGFANRWNIPRPIMTGTGADASQDAQLHSIVDACVADKGWLTIVTHANSWGNGTGMDTRLADMVQYCLDAGAEVTSVPIAFETFYPVFLLSELL